MTAVAPDTAGDETSSHLALLLGAQLSTSSLRLLFESLESLLLNVGNRLDDENADEDEREDRVVDSERRRDEFGRVSRSEGEENVLREFTSGEEDVLGDSDEEDVNCEGVAQSASEYRSGSRCDVRSFHPIQFIFCFWYSHR